MSSSLPPRPDACKTPVRQSTKPRSPNAPLRNSRAEFAMESDANRRLFDEPVRGDSFSAPEVVDEDFTTHRECVDPLYNANAQCSICLEAMGHHGGVAALSCRHGFCKDCLLEWSKSAHKCPLCNADFNQIYMASGEQIPVPAVVVRSVVLLRNITRQFLMQSYRGLMSEQMLRELNLPTDSRVPMYASRPTSRGTAEEFIARVLGGVSLDRVRPLGNDTYAILPPPRLQQTTAENPIVIE